MARFLFSVIAAKGHLNGIIPVAQALNKLGHDVSFHANSNIRDQLAQAGLPNYLGDLGKPKTSALEEQQFSEAIREGGFLWYRENLKKALLSQVSPYVETMREVIRSYRPDVVATDPILYRTIIACHLEDQPWAALSTALNPVIPRDIDSDLRHAIDDLEHDRQDLFSSFGMTDAKFCFWDCLSPFLTTCFSTPAFTGCEVPGVVQVGPSIPANSRGDEQDFPWHHLDPEKKKIYVSFGSLASHQPDFFNKIVEAFRSEKEIQLIIAVGGMDKTLIENPSPDAIIVDYAPQIQLLRKVDLFICHGGANSVTEALTTGTPMLIQPLFSDHPHQLLLVKRASVGDEIDLKGGTPEEINEKSLNMLRDERIANACKSIQASYQIDGAANAAACLNELTEKIRRKGRD